MYAYISNSFCLYDWPVHSRVRYERTYSPDFRLARVQLLRSLILCSDFLETADKSFQGYTCVLYNAHFVNCGQIIELPTQPILTPKVKIYFQRPDTYICRIFSAQNF